jgi:hypothetical protein
MKIERASHYKDKLSLISKRVKQIGSWLSLVSPEEFLEDDKYQACLVQSLSRDGGSLSGYCGHDGQGLRHCTKRRLQQPVESGRTARNNQKGSD